MTSQQDQGHTIEHMTAILRQHLKSGYTGKTKPYGFDKALDLARSKQLASQSDRTAHIFLESGHKAWIAYFLATRSSIRHFEGQKAELKTISSFNLLPEELQQGVAAKILSTEPHHTVIALINRLQMSGTKRRRLTDGGNAGQPQFLMSQHGSPHPRPDGGQHEEFSSSSHGSTEPDYTSTVTAGSFHQQQQRAVSGSAPTTQAEGQDAFLDRRQTTANPDYTNTTLRISTSVLNEAPDDRGGPSQSFEQQVVSKPAMDRIAVIFPQYICGAITRIGGKAAITMAFPFYDVHIHSTLGCLMSLAIRPNKVEFIAMELYGIHIEIENGVRCIVLADGVRCIPFPDMSLQGARPDAINRLLGHEITRAISESPAREEEVRQSILATSCVTFQIAKDPAEGGVLNLNLGLERGFGAKDMLFM